MKYGTIPDPPNALEVDDAFTYSQFLQQSRPHKDSCFSFTNCVGFTILVIFLLACGACLPYLYELYVMYGPEIQHRQQVAPVMAAPVHGAHHPSPPRQGKYTVVFRHAEKPTNVSINSLSAIGWARSQWLVKWINAEMRPKWVESAPIRAVITTLPSFPSGLHVRPLQTITPLSISLMLPITLSDTAEDAASVTRSALQQENTCVVICWQHEDIQNLMEVLGYKTDPWPDDDYDTVYVVSDVKKTLSVYQMPWINTTEYKVAMGKSDSNNRWLPSWFPWKLLEN